MWLSGGSGKSTKLRKASTDKRSPSWVTSPPVDGLAIPRGYDTPALARSSLIFS